MKKFVFELKDPLYEMAFVDGMLKDRKDLLLVIIEACRYMMYNPQVPNADNKMMLIVNEMNRLFFCTTKKMFSVMFPFHVNDYPSIMFDCNQIPVDSQMLSYMRQFLDSEEFEAEGALDFITPIEDFQEKENKDFWTVVRYLLTYEMGYVRYDDDLAGYNNACRQGTPKRHPRYHYDVNLDSQSTFKLGLRGQITPDKFVDFLDNKKDRPVVI